MTDGIELDHPNPLSGITATVFKHMQSPILLTVLKADIDAGVSDELLQGELGKRVAKAIKTVAGDDGLIADLAKAGARQIDYKALVEQIRCELLRIKRWEDRTHD